ncbi:MAG: aminofutalosine synthase MqnE, partial [Fimbriimonadales bacterium]
VHEYEIVYQDDAPGVRQQVLTRQALMQLIRDAGRVPVERDSLYQMVHRPDDAPESDARPKRQLRVV